ncbi:nitroreductase/quinone reductase family protein [Micromonospora sp. NPDC049679]|uniref:nitroreductase/quinone reductase family protein n=1 Tax=Micromonospora sp. NPDC049679 TaxID=3155920 RepID=UPI0033EC3F1A
MLAEPEVGVQVKADNFIATARAAGAEERPRLWEPKAGIFPTYDEYAAKAPREIPVVILERH